MVILTNRIRITDHNLCIIILVQDSIKVNLLKSGKLNNFVYGMMSNKRYGLLLCLNNVIRHDDK